MTYRVVYTEKFLERIEAHVDYLLGQGAAVHVIASWYDRLFLRLDRLDQMPHRLPVDEMQTRLTDRETRKLIYGDYLVFYQVDEARREVNLVEFQHGATRREA